MATVDILALAKEAQIAKQKNPQVIDATIGMFYDDEKQMVIPQIKEAYNKVSLETAFPYGSVSGGKLFEDNVLSWIFGDGKNRIDQHFHLQVLATPGGSGALSIFFGTYGNQGDFVVVPDIRWRYDFFTQAAKLQIKSYPLFKNKAFNLEGLKETLDEITPKQKSVMVVINDPCHNPTGYQLTEDEWKKLIELFNGYPHNEIYMIYDIAYFDYDPRGFESARKRFEMFDKFSANVSVLIAFSASKSLGIYGVRLGAAIGMFKNAAAYDYFVKEALENALGKWSTAPSIGIEIFNYISENNHKNEYLPYLKKLTSILKSRGDIFTEEARHTKLAYYPYQGGFFLLIKSENPLADYKKLIAEAGIYLIPMDQGLRLALCSLTTHEIFGLAQKIASIIC